MTKQSADPIIEEIHETRREIAKRFNYDVAKISEDARRRQALEGRPLWQPESVSSTTRPSGNGSLADTASTSPDAG